MDGSLDSPVFKTKPAGYVGQFPAGREWWVEIKSKAELREKRIVEGLSEKKNVKQLKIKWHE
jgi:hypothetical protein